METPFETAAHLERHEAVCAERYGHLVRLIEATTRRVGRLEALVVTVGAALISGMAGLVVTLIQKLGAHHG